MECMSAGVMDYVVLLTGPHEEGRPWRSSFVPLHAFDDSDAPLLQKALFAMGAGDERAVLLNSVYRLQEAWPALQRAHPDAYEQEDWVEFDERVLYELDLLANLYKDDVPVGPISVVAKLTVV